MVYLPFYNFKIFRISERNHEIFVMENKPPLASKPLGIWKWSMNDKSWQWAWSTLGQNFVKIHALGAELR